MVKRAYLERSSIRNANGEVREHCEEFVGADRSESEIMSDLMDSQEEVLVRCCANDIRSQECLP